MRLKKNTSNTKKEKKSFPKSNHLIEENGKKSKNEVLSERYNEKPKNIFIRNSNQNIYKPNKKFQKCQNIKNKKGLSQNFYNANTNKQINSISIKNIKMCNNINNNSKKRISSYINNENISNNILKHNAVNSNGIIREFTITKCSLIDNNLNQNKETNYNKYRMAAQFGTVRRRYKTKNISVEQRCKKLDKDNSLSDNNLLSNEEKTHFQKKNIYSRLYNRNTPSSFKHLTNNDLSQGILENDPESTYTNYYSNHTNDNNLRNIKLFYNSFFNKINNNNNNNKSNIISHNCQSLNKEFNFQKRILTNSSEIRNKTENNYYKHRSPINPIRNFEIIHNKESSSNFLNYNNKDKTNDNRIKSPKNRGHVKSMIIEGNLQIMSPYVNYSNKNNNNNCLTNLNRRSKNKVRITKVNNPNIVEYNLNISDDNDDNEDYQTEFNHLTKKNNKNSVYNIKNTEYNYNFKHKNILKSYFSSFWKELKPVVNSQFIIYGNYSKSNNYIKKTNRTNPENNDNLVNTPNFSEEGKTPTRGNIISCKRIKSCNNKDNIQKSNKNISIDNIDNNNTPPYKIIVKKRPKNETSEFSILYKLRNSSSNASNIFLNQSNKINNIYEICSYDNFNFGPIIKEKSENIKDKLSFNDDNEIIDYINKKYEEERKKKSYFNKKLRFTGFILTKKYKGKNLYDIRIEDDIDKINKQLKKEQVIVNNKMVELVFLEEKKENIIPGNNINELYEQINNLKIENEKLIIKENSQNDLIKRLDKEKQALLDEITKLTEEIGELKNINNKFIQEKKNQEKKSLLFKIENNSLFSINNIPKHKKENKQKSNENSNNKRNNDQKKENNINKIGYCIIKSNKKNNSNINEKKLYSKENSNTKDDFDKENVNFLNYSKNELNNMSNKDRLKSIGEKYINIDSEVSKFFIGNIIINSDLEDNLFIQNKSHPKINDLVEEGMSEDEYK